jgi:hypothetical protein
VGNATNFAAKLADAAKEPHNIHVFESFYNQIETGSRFNADSNFQNMWEKDPGSQSLWRSSWWWKPKMTSPLGLSLLAEMLYGVKPTQPPVALPPLPPFKWKP